jgi:hypothetical protein
MLDEFPKGLSLLLDDIGQLPFNFGSLIDGPKVADELPTEVWP